MCRCLTKNVTIPLTTTSQGKGMVRMTLKSRQELLKEARRQYWRAGRKEKTRILNEFVRYTGYHRKYALALLTGRYTHHQTTSRRRKRRYSQEVTDALVVIWTVCDYIASRRLQPFVAEMIQVLERQGRLQLTAETRQLLVQVSTATIDRLLKPARRARAPHGRSTTKPGTFLKQSIPIRTWADWGTPNRGLSRSTQWRTVGRAQAVTISPPWTASMCVPAGVSALSPPIAASRRCWLRSHRSGNVCRCRW